MGSKTTTTATTTQSTLGARIENGLGWLLRRTWVDGWHGRNEEPKMAETDRQVIIVSGSLGAGKTTLARSLALELDFALIAKDDLKETLFDALDGPVGDLDFSRKTGGVALELLWMLAERCPEGHPGIEFSKGRRMGPGSLQQVDGDCRRGLLRVPGRGMYPAIQ